MLRLFSFFAALLLAVYVVAGSAWAIGPTVVERTLACGARLVVSEQPALPLVLVRVLVNAGARLDPPGREGLANLTADMLTEGTRSRTAVEINDAVDFVGGSLGSGAERDYAEIQARFLAKDFPFAVDLLAEVLAHPAFSPAEFERRREAVLAAIRDTLDSPTRVAADAFDAAVFAGEPYGHPVEGTEESVRRIVRDDVTSFYKQHYAPTGTLIVVVGDIRAADAHRLFDSALSGWVNREVSRFTYPEIPPATGRVIRIHKPVAQAAIVLGHRGVARADPDFETLRVMNYVLGGGGFSSRLTDSIRTQAGLAYSVSSYFAAYESTGSFQAVMQTKNASVEDAIARARKELVRIREEPITEEELDEAKRYLTGSFALNFDSLGEIADFVSTVAFYNLGWDYADRYLRSVAAVTKEDLQRVAREYLRPDALIEVVVGDLDGIGKEPQEVVGD